MAQAIITPKQFVAKWATTLNERQTYQLHFIDVCHPVGHEPHSVVWTRAAGLGETR